MIEEQGSSSDRKNMGASADAETGPSGFDPARVRVTAADYNGQSWDGSPFNHVPKWLEMALRQGAITIKEDDRDYALWAVETPSGTKIAEPGDDIVCLDGHLDVRKESWLAAIAAGARSGETPQEARSEGRPERRCKRIAQP